MRERPHSAHSSPGPPASLLAGVKFHRALRWARTTNNARIQRLCFLLALLLFLAAAQAFAQGCTQCLDSTRATPPAVQAAYRHAILLLGGFAAAIFIAGAILLRREP